MNRLLTESAVRLASRIAAREVSSEEVVRAHIERARTVHARINAVVADRYEAALAEARACDARIRAEAGSKAGSKAGAGELPPLFGVPCSIKECFALTGMPNASGLVSRRDVRATADAPAVARLRAAGAIPIGVTNTSELCMWMETNNRLYGRTRNPYDPGRIVGGSSGGEGALVAAGGAPFGLGSDVGGSIRMPAFFCGVFGHKPSPRLVPNEGQFPTMGPDGQGLLATGPLARRAEDLWPLLGILADTRMASIAGDPARVEVAGLTVLDAPDNGRFRVAAELRQAQVAAARALAKRGARVEAFASPLFGKTLDIWSVLMKAAASASFAEQMGEERSLRELGRWLTGRSQHTLPAIGLALLERLPGLKSDRLEGAREMAARLRGEIVDALGSRGVLLFPPYPRTAPRHNTPLVPPTRWIYTAIFNALELPVTQVPLGLDRGGLPLGVQVVGAPGADAITIAVARALEQDFGGWVPPPV